MFAVSLLISAFLSCLLSSIACVLLSTVFALDLLACFLLCPLLLLVFAVPDKTAHIDSTIWDECPLRDTDVLILSHSKVAKSLLVSLNWVFLPLSLRFLELILPLILCLQFLLCFFAYSAIAFDACLKFHFDLFRSPLNRVPSWFCFSLVPSSWCSFCLFRFLLCELFLIFVYLSSFRRLLTAVWHDVDAADSGANAQVSLNGLWFTLRVFQHSNSVCLLWTFESSCVL